MTDVKMPEPHWEHSHSPEGDEAYWPYYDKGMMEEYAAACVAKALSNRIGCAEVELPKPGDYAVNEAGWKFIEAMPVPISAEVFNNIKPAMHAAICCFLREYKPTQKDE